MHLVLVESPEVHEARGGGGTDPAQEREAQSGHQRRLRGVGQAAHDGDPSGAVRDGLRGAGLDADSAVWRTIGMLHVGSSVVVSTAPNISRAPYGLRSISQLRPINPIPASSAIRS